jgi:hypothetical protein
MFSTISLNMVAAFTLDLGWFGQQLPLPPRTARLPINHTTRQCQSHKTACNATNATLRVIFDLVSPTWEMSDKMAGRQEDKMTVPKLCGLLILIRIYSGVSLCGALARKV